VALLYQGLAVALRQVEESESSDFFRVVARSVRLRSSHFVVGIRPKQRGGSYQDSSRIPYFRKKKISLSNYWAFVPTSRFSDVAMASDEFGLEKS